MQEHEDNSKTPWRVQPIKSGLGTQGTKSDENQSQDRDFFKIQPNPEISITMSNGKQEVRERFNNTKRDGCSSRVSDFKVRDFLRPNIFLDFFKDLISNIVISHVLRHCGLQNAEYLCMCGPKPVGCEDVFSSDFKQVCLGRGELQGLREFLVCVPVLVLLCLGKS